VKCKSCDVLLSDAEAIRKSSVSKEYLDLCDRCLGTIAHQIPNSIDEDDPFWDNFDDWEDEEAEESSHSGW
jgi:trehalose-6-phosphate synthase